MKVLLVEGRDDQHVVLALLKYSGLPTAFSISEKGGIERLLEVLPVQIKGSSIDTIGIVVDADVNLPGRWDAIRHILMNSGYESTPVAPSRDGTIVEEPALPKIGIWLMPDNTVTGMLEDFVAKLVPPEDAAIEHATLIVESLPPEARKFTPAHTSKARIHTWLAWQEDPGTPMGLAITKKYLDPRAPDAGKFLAWLEKLFFTLVTCLF